MDIEVGTICVATLRLSTSMVFAKLPAALTTGGGMGLWWILPGIGIFLIALLGLSIALWRTGAYRVAVHKYRKMGNRWPVTTLSPGMAAKGVRAGKSLDGGPLTPSPSPSPTSTAESATDALALAVSGQVGQQCSAGHRFSSGRRYQRDKRVLGTDKINGVGSSSDSRQRGGGSLRAAGEPSSAYRAWAS